MRIGTYPTSLIEWILMKLNLFPLPIGDSFGYMMFARSIKVAHELGIFDKLSELSLSAEDLAKEIGASERGTRFLLDALVGNKYLKYKDERFANTRMANKWMVSSSKDYIGKIFPFTDFLLNYWNNLETSILNGKPIVDYTSSKDFLKKLTYILNDTAKLNAPEVLKKIRISSSKEKMIDIGGSHGYYSRAFCEKYPNLKATVIDLPETIEIGRKLIDGLEISNRITFKALNFLKDDFGNEYDIALLFNIVHGFTVKENIELLAKVYKSLRKNGIIVIWDMFRDERSRMPQLSLLFALNTLLTTMGNTYHYKEVLSWLRDIGFVNIKRLNLLRAPGTFLIKAIK